jgi:hypothetical protein
MNYHRKIMNIGANALHAGSPRQDVQDAYMEGHKRARHDAAEIANFADAEILRLRAALEKYRGQINQYGENTAADDLAA